MRLFNDFEEQALKVANRADLLQNMIHYSSETQACIRVAIDIEIGVEEFGKLSSMFGITKDEYIDYILTLDKTMK